MTLHSWATLHQAQRLRSRSTPLISLLGPQSRTSPFAIPTLQTRLGSRYLSGISRPKFWPPPLMVLVLSQRRRARYHFWTHTALLFVDYLRCSWLPRPLQCSPQTLNSLRCHLIGQVPSVSLTRNLAL